MAFVAANDGASIDERALLLFIKERLADYKVPRHIRFVSEFPLTATGKPQKFVMREAMVRELGLVEAKTA